MKRNILMLLALASVAVPMVHSSTGSNAQEPTWLSQQLSDAGKYYRAHSAVFTPATASEPKEGYKQIAQPRGAVEEVHWKESDADFSASEHKDSEGKFKVRVPKEDASGGEWIEEDTRPFHQKQGFVATRRALDTALATANLSMLGYDLTTGNNLIWDLVCRKVPSFKRISPTSRAGKAAISLVTAAVMDLVSSGIGGFDRPYSVANATMTAGRGVKGWYNRMRNKNDASSGAAATSASRAAADGFSV